MSNIAGKAYAMSLVTPINGRLMTFVNKFIFWLVGTPLMKKKLNGLLTLSMIHYARWVIVKGNEFPRLSAEQPEEELEYSYMFFFSNFNGSWAQYVDSFSAAIPSGLDLLWFRNVGWPNSVPEQPFHRYVTHDQLFTNHYYNAYPMAASNDIKSAKKVKDSLSGFMRDAEGKSPEAFAKGYNTLLKTLQHDLGQMGPTPVVSLANAAAEEQQNYDEKKSQSERVAKARTGTNPSEAAE